MKPLARMRVNAVSFNQKNVMLFQIFKLNAAVAINLPGFEFDSVENNFVYFARYEVDVSFLSLNRVKLYCRF